MSSALSATGKAKLPKHATPFDQVLACEEREEARVQAVLKDLEQTERDAEQAMRDSEVTQEENLRNDARAALLEEREAIGKEMEQREQSNQKEIQMLEEKALRQAPAIVQECVESMLAEDYFSRTA